MTATPVKIAFAESVICGARRSVNVLRTIHPGHDFHIRFGIGLDVANEMPFTFRLVDVIDNYGGSGAESDELRAEGVEFDVAAGDVVEANERLYRVGVLGDRFARPEMCLNPV